MGKVLFASENGLERAENLRAVFEAYGGEKDFERGWESYVDAPRMGYTAAVVDTMPPFMRGKGDCKVVFIGHGITGGKLYGFDQPRGYVDERVRGQIDYAVCASTRTVEIAARQTGASIGHTVPLGMPRTDAIVGSSKGDGGTFLAGVERAYLYAPTFRDGYERAPMPEIDWRLVDLHLRDWEVLAVKRHYYTAGRLTPRGLRRVVEIPNDEPTTPYLIDCDVLLTDFSSIVLDAHVAGKPALLGVDGAAGYLKERGTYFSFPRMYAARWLTLDRNEDHMIHELRRAQDDGGWESELFGSFYADMCDGRSAERVAEFVAEIAG